MSDDKMVPLPICACREVHYDPVKNPNGTCTDRWRCASCGVEFIRYLKPDWSELSSRMVDVERRVAVLEVARSGDGDPVLMTLGDETRWLTRDADGKLTTAPTEVELEVPWEMCKAGPGEDYEHPRLRRTVNVRAVGSDFEEPTKGYGVGGDFAWVRVPVHGAGVPSEDQE